MTNVAALLEAFDREDPGLRPAEKETIFRFAGDEDRLHFFTAKAGLGRRLIAHDNSTVEAVTVRRGDRRPRKDPEEITDGDRIVSVRGRLPVGVLAVTGTPRKSAGQADVVTHRVLEGVPDA